DGSTAAIMTLNLTSQYYASSRDFAVIENDPQDVAAIEATCEADISDSAIAPPLGDDLVWSPTNSQSAILSVINSARYSLLVENEEMGDAGVVDALVSAAGRGVRVQVVMTNNDNDYSSQFGQLVAAGVEVSTYASDAPLYIHAKVVLADYGTAVAQAFIGSENFSSASLTRNRELGLITSDPTILRSVTSTFTSDFDGATPWPGSMARTSVVNAASLQSGVAAGGWISIFGTNLAPVTDDWTNYISGGRLPTSLDGVSVTVGGQAAYVAYISPTQINAVAPEMDAGTVSVVVSGPNGTGAQVTSVAQTIQPALFQWGNYAVATHLDYSSATHAAPGEVIILWGTGFGPTTPPAPFGIAVPSGASYETASPVAVTLGNTPVAVYSAALAPGFAALYQIAIQVPESLEDGDYSVVAAVSGVQSPSNVLLAVLK
ncbi:MAG TPA: phospholipase D-like domain-containing protein, partial [Ktedonobacterales bacterium]|nr:phospholipase D-like domain-containing protein [Ktedonobacterales bacterium]